MVFYKININIYYSKDSEEVLVVFENSVMRKIFGTFYDGKWRFRKK